MIGDIKIKMPTTAHRGEVVMVKCNIEHPNESGLRKDPKGKIIPRSIIVKFIANYNNKPVFGGQLERSVAENPFFSFPLKVNVGGTLMVVFVDELGTRWTATAGIEVVE